MRVLLFDILSIIPYFFLKKVKLYNGSLTVLAQDSIWKAEFAGPIVRISPAVTRVYLFPAGGLWRPSPIVPESGPKHPGQRPKEVSYSVEKLSLCHIRAL